jgi:YVTN family beta-propeller protein
VKIRHKEVIIPTSIAKQTSLQKEEMRTCKEMASRRTLCPMLYALCVFLVLCGCQAAVSRLRPPLEEEGEICLYLQPYPQEAERLRFSIEGISAVSADGREFPFEISLREIKASDVRRQRRLAYGRVPPGSYVGLSFKAKKAILKVEDGDADLLVPEVPVRTDFPFSVIRKRAYVISLSFKYRESISGGFSFSPVFSPFIPTRPIISLAGYVSNTISNNITVFDKKLGQVVGMIATGKGPAGMALDQRLRRVYIAASGDDEIEVIDISGGELINAIKLSIGDRPQELALTPDGRTLLSLNAGTNTVSFIDPLSMSELNRVNVGMGPRSILIDSNGRRAYVFNTLAGTISVLDIASRAIITTFSTDPGPLRGQFNRRGDNLYVIHERSSYLTVVDPISFRILKRFSVGPGMNFIRVDAQTDLVYISRKNDTTVEVYNPLSFVSVDFVKTGGTIDHMTIDGELNNLYLVNSDMKSLMISNLVRKKIVSEMDVGEGPYWVSIMGER